MRKPLQTPTLQTLGGSRDMSSYHTSSQECSLIASFSGCMTGRQVTVLQCELSNLPTQSLDMGGKKILCRTGTPLFSLSGRSASPGGVGIWRNYPRISVNYQRISIIGYLGATPITLAEGQENKEKMNTWCRERRHSGDTQGTLRGHSGESKPPPRWVRDL